MKKNSDILMELYGKATRVFVDYEDYTKEECVFYYRVLEKVIDDVEPKISNYLISGLAAIIETSEPLKDLLYVRFSIHSKLSLINLAKELNISKQGLLQKLQKGFNFIKCRDSQYDISKRIALLNQSISHLQMVRQTHENEYKRKSLPIETLPLKKRTYTCLRNSGIDTVAAFMALKESEIKLIPGVGEKTHYDIVETQQKLFAAFNNEQYQKAEPTLEQLGLSNRAVNCIRHIGVKTIEEFINLTKRDVLAAWHAGEKTWQEIYEKQQILKRGEI